MKRFSGLVACVAMVVATSLSSFAGYTGAGGVLSGQVADLDPKTGALGQAFVAKNVSGVGAFVTNLLQNGEFSDFGSKSFFSGDYNFGAASTVGAALSVGSLGSEFGRFSGTVSFDDGSVTFDNDQTSRQIIATGTFTPGTSTFYNTITASIAGRFQITVSKTGAGGVWSGSWTMDTTPASVVPEPASLAIFGLGAAGFAARRFRRK